MSVHVTLIVLYYDKKKGTRNLFLTEQAINIDSYIYYVSICYIYILVR